MDERIEDERLFAEYLEEGAALSLLGRLFSMEYWIRVLR